MTSNGTVAVYQGTFMKKPELLVAKALVESCPYGVFREVGPPDPADEPE